jgi:hypothetical protein
VSSLLVGGADTVFAAMAQNDDPDELGTYSYDFRLYRSVDGGDTWSEHHNFPSPNDPGFIYGLHKNNSTGRMWVTNDGRLFHSDDRGSSWTEHASGGIPTNGIFVVATSGNIVLAGGWAGLWRSTDGGSNWTEVVSGNDFDFSDTGDDRGDLQKLNRVSWHGVHQILVDEYVWVVSYTNHDYDGSTNKGIWRSSDGGETFAMLMNSTLQRGVAVDSCSHRVHITSGAAHTAGTNVAAALDSASGKLTCRFDYSGALLSKVVDASGTDYRYRFGGAIVASGSNDYVYVGVPGYGAMRQTLATGGTNPCDTQLGGGGEMRARKTQEEGYAAPIEPSMFRLEEVYDQEFYDLSGRKVKVRKAGIYFKRRLMPGGVTLRTVVVTN